MLTKSAVSLVVIIGLTGTVGCAGVNPPTGDATPATVDHSPPPNEGTPSKLGGVDPTRFTPYFEKVRGGPEALAVLDRADYGAARLAFLALAQSEGTSEVISVRARFVAAVCAHRDGEHEAALTELPQMIEPLPLIADHIRYMAAVSAYRVNQFDRTIELAGDVSRESGLRADAELLIGDSLRAMGRVDEVEAHYRTYVHRHRGGPRLSEATFKLAEAVEGNIEGEDALDRVREAIRWYRRIMYRYPRSSWARQARERVTELASRLPNEEAQQCLGFSADEQLELAESYARVHRHTKAMEAFSEVLELTDPDGPIGCQARLGLGRAAYNGRQRKRAAVVLAEAAEKCDEPDVRAWALYLAGRSNTSKGNDRTAVDLLATLEDEHPGHRLADDARLRRAHAELRMGKAAEFGRLLDEFPDRYPQGDMLCEAQWQLAWHTYREGTPDEALNRFQFADQVCGAPEEGAGGRERYWAARILEKMGRRPEAVRAYESVALEHPLTFYMILSVERLEGLSPSSLPRIWRRLGAGQPTTGTWRFDPQALKGRPAFVRGIELHRLGLSSLARIEFASANDDLDGAEHLRWLSALLHHKVGSYTVSHWIARRELTEWQARPPAGDNAKYWRIGYPQGFTGLVTQEAENAGIEPELIWGVMREESGFSPTIESYANAVGLLQLLPATARRFAKGLPANRVGLKRPENNIPIAARYLAFLLERQGGSPVLAVASYNAGEGAVDRWRRANPDLEFDEALESFSYDQTRRYTRRVLSSYGAYHYLYNGQLPRLLAGSGTIAPTATPAPATGRGGSTTKTP